MTCSLLRSLPPGIMVASFMSGPGLNRAGKTRKENHDPQEARVELPKHIDDLSQASFEGEEL